MEVREENYKKADEVKTDRRKVSQQRDYGCEFQTIQYPANRAREVKIHDFGGADLVTDFLVLR